MGLPFTCGEGDVRTFLSSVSLYDVSVPVVSSSGAAVSLTSPVLMSISSDGKNNGGADSSSCSLVLV